MSFHLSNTKDTPICGRQPNTFGTLFYFYFYFLKLKRSHMQGLQEQGPNPKSPLNSPCILIFILQTLVQYSQHLPSFPFFFSYPYLVELVQDCHQWRIVVSLVLKGCGVPYPRSSNCMALCWRCSLVMPGFMLSLELPLIWESVNLSSLFTEISSLYFSFFPLPIFLKSMIIHHFFSFLFLTKIYL